jgi:cytochrome P450
MSTWTAHRNPTHFPDPDDFKPSRWLSGKSDTSSIADNEGRGGTEEMKKLYMPFTKGMYKCIGQGMAMLNMRLIIATLVRKYDVKLAKGASPSDMDWDDHFLLIPRGGCTLDFTPI